MSQLIFCAVLLLVVHSAIAATLDPVSLPGNGEIGTCPTQERREAVIQNISASSVRMIIQNNVTTSNPAISRNCGPGLWHRVAHLNMSNSSQQCPSAWREYNNITSRVYGVSVTHGTPRANQDAGFPGLIGMLIDAKTLTLSVDLSTSVDIINGTQVACGEVLNSISSPPVTLFVIGECMLKI